MKRIIQTLTHTFILLLIAEITLACNYSSLNLVSMTDLGGGQYEFTVSFCAGGGLSTTEYGAEQNTYTWAVGLSGGGATFASYPTNLTSPQTGAIYAALAPLTYGGLEYLVYDLDTYTASPWWTTIEGGYGTAGSYCITFTFVTNAMPNQILIGGAESAGIIVPGYGCNGNPDMEINFGVIADVGAPELSLCNGSSVTINGTASGGTAPYTYSWSTGATTPSITVSPIVSTTYTLTVTDALGNTDFDDVVVYTHPVPTANAGADQTITQGYGPTCVTLTGSGTGGSDPKTYLWSTGATTASISVCPTATTTYTLTVTDYYGCSSTDNVVVTHKDVRCGPSLTKVYMCKAGTTKCYSVSQVPSKLLSGWTLGACWMKLGDDVVISDNPISIFPNPASNTAEIVFISDEDATAYIEIYNAAGQKQNIFLPEIQTKAGEEISHVIAVNELPSGMYYVSISTNAGGRMTEKLIITR
ncbi:MAG: T9SS type A sorting domain-containing protein [Chitinophagales bacterium]